MSDYISGVELLNELNDLTEQLKKSTRQLGDYGRNYAEKQRDYKVALAQAILKRKAEGLPATIVIQIANGDTANERFERDKAEVLYKSSLESINTLKTLIRVNENQINKEWSNG